MNESGDGPSVSGSGDESGDGPSESGSETETGNSGTESDIEPTGEPHSPVGPISEGEESESESKVEDGKKWIRVA